MLNYISAFVCLSNLTDMRMEGVSYILAEKKKDNVYVSSMKTIYPTISYNFAWWLYLFYLGVFFLTQLSSKMRFCYVQQISIKRFRKALQTVLGSLIRKCIFKTINSDNKKL